MSDWANDISKKDRDHQERVRKDDEARRWQEQQEQEKEEQKDKREGKAPNES